MNPAFIPTRRPLTTRLTYAITASSEHSHRYVPENILVNAPDDQSSRWSGVHEGSNVKQWLLLRLDSPSVVESITFGKFNKNHPCNVKEFKIYVGMTEAHMTEILHAGLKNDAIPETFPLRHINSAGVCFPSLFLKIVPLSAHSHSFHVSIWYVALAGISDEAFVRELKAKYDDYRETAALRHILKHLRKRRFLAPFKSIIANSGVEVEHPLVTQLYDSLVSKGDWLEAESVLTRASSQGLFDAYLHSTQPHSVWRRIYGLDPDGDVPSRRGGHAMCIDEANGLIYMFGGWDGHKSLDDFWAYSIPEDRWRVLSRSASKDKGGPGPRSCHKMVFDSKLGVIYLLGRLSESDGITEDTTDAPRDQNTDEGHAVPDVLDSAVQHAEFYRYHVEGPNAGSWVLLSGDTASSGGPPLIFDHQMAMDSAAQVLYVCGGRVNDSRAGESRYCGLYSYDVATNKWRLLQPTTNLGAPQPAMSRRLGHIMVFDPKGRVLYVFAGMEEEKYLSDMYAYHLDTNIVTELFSNFTASGGPDAAFAQRAVIDPSLQEIYLNCGLTRSQQSFLPRLDSDSMNWLFRYGDNQRTWSKILPEEARENAEHTIQQPRARYAHQMVYDSRTKTVYLHGGNAGRMLDPGSPDGGREGLSERRLDDFWSMQLKRPRPEEIARRAILEVRCQQFREMCRDSPPVKALRFLQTEVAEVVDHACPTESNTFRELLAHLLSGQVNAPSRHTGDATAAVVIVSSPHTDLKKDGQGESSGVSGNDRLSQEIFEQRTEVFERLLAFFPPDATEPKSDLIDLIDWCEESIHD